MWLQVDLGGKGPMLPHVLIKLAAVPSPAHMHGICVRIFSTERTCERAIQLVGTVIMYGCAEWHMKEAYITVQNT